MSSDRFIDGILKKSLQGDELSIDDSMAVLSGTAADLMPLVNAAFKVRKASFGLEVMIHVINNVQNGYCPEDCKYCAQSATSGAVIEKYAMKSEDEIYKEAEAAFRQGAFRYCMVFSGTGPSEGRIERLAGIIREIKRRWPLEVCVSPGVITQAQAESLKSAGLDRLNHNLNTSENHYGAICTTHSFADRLKTLESAKSAGLGICSGVIIGMGEAPCDVVDMALKLRSLAVDSIPVNFLVPIPGTVFAGATSLTPEYCLRVLCLFRFLNPKAELRLAAGRELHLRALEPLGLYVANSLFLQGYLNTKGASDVKTLRMIRDLGLTVRSEVPLEELSVPDEGIECVQGMKSVEELRPFHRG